MSEELEEAVLSAREALEKRLADISRITEINEIIMMVVEKNLAAIKKDLEAIGRGGGTMKIIDHSLTLLSNTTTNPKVIELKKVIREQILVLLTGSLESYLSDIVRIIGNIQPDFFRFKVENENISFNQAMLRNSFTLGDAILEHIENKKYSFQDLKSTIDVFENYLDISLDVVDVKDELILMAATRHLIVHNNSIIDRKFLKQIRDTKYRDNFTLGGAIDVDDDLIESMTISIKELADRVIASIIGRIEQDKDGI